MKSLETDQPQPPAAHGQHDLYCYEADISKEPEDLSLNTSRHSSDGKYPGNANC